MYLLGVVPLVYCMPKSMEMRIVFCCTLMGLKFGIVTISDRNTCTNSQIRAVETQRNGQCNGPSALSPLYISSLVVWLWGQRGGVKGTEQLPDAPSPVLSPPNSQCCTDTWGRGNDLSGDVPAVTDTLRCVVFRMEKTKDLTAAETCG